MSKCPFCCLEEVRIGSSSPAAFAIRDLFPVTEGHTLVIPRVHVKSLYELKAQDQEAIWKLVAHVREKIKREFGVDAFNIGINDGSDAGQTIEHANVHVIPRRHGDVPDARGEIRNIFPAKARYWERG